MKSLLSPPSHLHPRQSTSRSPPRSNFLTLCTERLHAVQQQKPEESNRSTLAQSPTDRNKTKIRLVSPLKHTNRSNLATKQNSPSQNAQTRSKKQASPFKSIRQIQLGGSSGKSPHKNLNEISNISIKQHLELGQKQAESSSNKPLPCNKYAAFVIMSPSHQAKAEQRPSASPFRKQPVNHITINSKHFDIASLKSRVIHVSPFHHVATPNALPQVRFLHAERQPTIREETETSSLKESCEQDLREVREMRREMEEEGNRIKQVLKSSRISQEVCISQLVYAQEERTMKKNPSKMLNFEDVPLHQSRIQGGTELKFHLSPPESCNRIETSLIHNQINCLPHIQSIKENQAETAKMPLAQAERQVEAQEKEEKYKQEPLKQHKNQLTAPRTSIKQTWTNSQKTLINELNFVTAKRLNSEDKKLDQMCVQTEVIEECDQVGSGQKSSRFNLAIFTNEECKISLGTSREENKQNEEEIDCKQARQAAIPIQLNREETQMIESYQLKQPRQEQQQYDPQINQSQEQQKKEQKDEFNILHQYECVPPTAAPQSIVIPSLQAIAELSRSHLQNEQQLHQSNLSLQLQPAQADVKKFEVQRVKYSPKQSQKSSQKIVNTAKQVQFASKKETTSLLSMKSVISNTSGKDGGASRRLSSKRLINNSIYL